jgi:hypothetical protein
MAKLLIDKTKFTGIHSISRVYMGMSIPVCVQSVILNLTS